MLSMCLTTTPGPMNKSSLTKARKSNLKTVTRKAVARIAAGALVRGDFHMMSRSAKSQTVQSAYYISALRKSLMSSPEGVGLSSAYSSFLREFVVNAKTNRPSKAESRFLLKAERFAILDVLFNDVTRTIHRRRFRAYLGKKFLEFTLSDNGILEILR